MFLELENITEFYQFQPWLNTFCSSTTFPETSIIFSCFPKETITLYSKYNNFLSPVPMPKAEALELKPPMGIGCLFLPYSYNLDLEVLCKQLFEFFKSLDDNALEYSIEIRPPRFDLHSLDSGGYLLSIYCQGISLDFLFKPKEGIVQVACTKLIPFKGNTPYYIICSLQFLKEILTK